MVKQAILAGNINYQELMAQAKQTIDEAGLKTDYVVIRDAISMAPIDDKTQEIVILGAAYLGKARLIDNLSFNR